MKKLLAFLLLASAFHTSFAQAGRTLQSRAITHRQMLNALLQKNRAAAAAKTTSGVSVERVIAQSTRNNSTGALNDSFNLKYGPNRGSFYDYNTMIFPYNYPYSTSPMFNYAGTFTKPRVYFDTMRHWSVNTNTLVYGFSQMDIAGYDANQNTTAYKERFADSAIYTNMNFINRFNSVNNIDSAYSFNWHSGLSDSAFKQFFSYNSLNNIIKDSTYEYHSGSWHLLSKTIYTYNGSNDLILIDNYSNTTDTTFTLPLLEQVQYTNTYDGSHRLTSVASSFYNGTTLAPYLRDTFAYAGTTAWHNSWKEYQYDPINLYWAPMFYMTKTVNLAGLPDTVNIRGFDSLLNAWVPQTMNVMHYNSYNDPDTLKDYEYNFTSFPATPSFTTVYYYQTYLISTGTDHSSPTVSQINVYPNPCSDAITISGIAASTTSAVSYSLMTMSGQIIFRETAPWQPSRHISLSGITPGIYRLIVHDDQGAMLHSQNIIKQ